MSPIGQNSPPEDRHLVFFLIAGCIGSLGYWKTRGTASQKKVKCPFHYDLSLHNLCMKDFFLCCRIALDSCGQFIAGALAKHKNPTNANKQPNQQNTNQTQEDRHLATWCAHGAPKTPTNPPRCSGRHN